MPVIRNTPDVDVEQRQFEVLANVRAAVTIPIAMKLSRTSAPGELARGA